MPAAEFELILYAIRMVLKFSFFPNPLARYDRRGRHEELDFLESRAQRDSIDPILRKHLPAPRSP